CLPRMPPAAFFSLTARSTDCRSDAPVAAASPVSGPNTPILMVSAEATYADPATMAEATSPTASKLRRSLVISVLSVQFVVHSIQRCRLAASIAGRRLPTALAEIARPDLGILQKIRTAAGQYDPTSLYDETARRQTEREFGVLLNEKDCRTIPMKAADGRGHLFNKDGGKSERRFVK